MLSQLMVHVNDDFALDAGTCEELQGLKNPELLIRPSAITLFQQLLDYLRAKPDPPSSMPGSLTGREGVAAVAMTLRWGSYFAVLADREKPLWGEVRTESTSRIADSEMARINIEASAALAQWIDLYRKDSNNRYVQLVNRAVFYLPIPRKTSTLQYGPLLALAIPERAAEIIRAVQMSGRHHFERVRASCERYPSRVLANALINTAWRNGPIEDIHAGHFRGYPLNQRRIKPSEERNLMNVASRHFSDGMSACAIFCSE